MPDQDSIFEFGDKFGYESPFGNWLPEVASPSYRLPKISEITVKRSPIAGIFARARLLDPQKNAGIRVIPLKIDVIVVDSYGERVEVELGNRKEIAVFDYQGSSAETFRYWVLMDVEIPIPYSSYDFTFTARIYSLTQQKMLDIKTTTVNVDEKGNTNLAKDGKSPVPKISCACNSPLSVEQLAKIAPHAKMANIQMHLPGINLAFEKNEINTCARRAHFLAQILHESGSLRYTKEAGVSESEYGGFIGRGLIQITGKENYEAYQTFSGEDVTSSLENKKKLEQSPHAANSAGWFWLNRAKLNDEADENDFIMITRTINGGFNGYDDRLNYLKRAVTVLFQGCNPSLSTAFEFKSSKAYNDKRGSFAWGLWHDPGIDSQHVNTCSNDKSAAIAGYSRLIELTDDSFDETNWYNIKSMDVFSAIKFSKVIKGKTKYFVDVREAAELRLKALML